MFEVLSLHSACLFVYRELQRLFYWEIPPYSFAVLTVLLIAGSKLSASNGTLLLVCWVFWKSSSRSTVHSFFDIIQSPPSILQGITISSSPMLNSAIDFVSHLVGWWRQIPVVGIIVLKCKSPVFLIAIALIFLQRVDFYLVLRWSLCLLFLRPPLHSIAPEILKLSRLALICCIDGPRVTNLKFSFSHGRPRLDLEILIEEVSIKGHEVSELSLSTTIFCEPGDIMRLVDSKFLSRISGMFTDMSWEKTVWGCSDGMTMNRIWKGDVNILGGQGCRVFEDLPWLHELQWLEGEPVNSSKLLAAGSATQPDQTTQ